MHQSVTCSQCRWVPDGSCSLFFPAPLDSRPGGCLTGLGVRGLRVDWWGGLHASWPIFHIHWSMARNGRSRKSDLSAEVFPQQLPKHWKTQDRKQQETTGNYPYTDTKFIRIIDTGLAGLAFCSAGVRLVWLLVWHFLPLLCSPGTSRKCLVRQEDCRAYCCPVLSVRKKRSVLKEVSCFGINFSSPSSPSPSVHQINQISPVLWSEVSAHGNPLVV